MMIFKYFHLRGAQKHIKRKTDQSRIYGLAMHVGESIPRWPRLQDEGYLYAIYYEKALSAEMAPGRRLSNRRQRKEMTESR